MSPKQFVVALAGAVMVAMMSAGQVLAGASDATLTIVSPSQTLTVGQTVTIEIRENSGTAPVNAIQSNVSYSDELLDVVKIDSSLSAFNVTAEEREAGGTIFVARGKTGEPLKGTQMVTRITMKATGAGSAELHFADGTVLVRSDNNEAMSPTTTGAVLKITAPKPTATPKPSQTPKPSPTATPTPGMGGGGSTPTPAPKATPTPTPTPEAPTKGTVPTLPETGAAALGGVVGVAATGYAVQAWRRSRSDLKAALRKQR